MLTVIRAALDTADAFQWTQVMESEWWTVGGLALVFTFGAAILNKAGNAKLGQGTDPLPDNSIKPDVNATPAPPWASASFEEIDQYLENVNQALERRGFGLRERQPSSSAESEEEVTAEQVAERSAFIRQAKLVVEQLHSYSYGPIATSVFGAFHKIQEATRSHLDTTRPLESSVFRLLENRLGILSQAINDLQVSVNGLAISHLDDYAAGTTCNRFRDLFHEQQLLLVETVDLAQQFWHREGIEWNAQWRANVGDTLAQGYDELVRRLKDMRRDAPNGQKALLPDDNQMEQFKVRYHWPS